jgi:ferrous iron transport protein B
MSDSPTTPRVIALAGNPNTGKSSIFNMLTGAKQHVGNWPGKTVERVDGRYTHDGDEFDLVDLPGTYSLNASSPEEIIARDFLVGGELDGAVVVVDAANLERNLYLAIQVLEIGFPTVVAVNMSDVARSRGLEIDPIVLSDRLEAPAVATVARTGKGLDDLRDVIAATCVREESQ